MPFARLDDIDFYYEQRGEGPRLLFINGTGGDLRMKPNFVDGPLSGSFETLAYDQRGLGQTGKPDRPYSMADYADDAARLLDHVEWDRTHVFGVSFGGMVAQEMALRHPGRIDRLVLCCTSSGGAGGSSYPLHELAKLGPDEYLRQILAIGDTRWGSGEEGRGAGVFQKIIEFMKSRQEIGAETPGEGSQTSQRPAESPETIARGAALQLQARLGHDTWDRLDQIEVPTLLCAGRYDGIAPPENMRNLASRISDSTLEFFEGGHGFLLEDRSAYARISDFLLA